MNIKNNRVFSFIIITLAYLVAVTVGVFCYLCIYADIWLKILIADVVATVVVFIFSLIFNNASVYDPYWSVQPMVIALAIAFEYGFSFSAVLACVAVCVWGVRLTANWAYTFKSLNCQDWRYTMLKDKTGIFYPLINFIGIHMVPTLVVYACIMPVVYVTVSKPIVNALAVIFFVCSLLAVLLQGVSDVQMHTFRKHKCGTFIRTGLWKYSRHPNYLAEILMWWSVAAYAFSLMPSCWFFFIGAILNTALFLSVSIPMADNRQSRKAGFDVYKKQTRMLLPIPKHKVND